jgi:hypothetical protein
MRCLVAALLFCAGTMGLAQQSPSSVGEAVQLLKKSDTWNLTGGLVFGPSQQLLATRLIANNRDAEKHFLSLLQTGSDVGRLYGALGLRFIESKKLNDPSTTSGIKGKEVKALHGCIMGREKDTDILQLIKSGKLDELETKPEKRS